jgi:tellurite resistance protein TehA-like permease
MKRKAYLTVVAIAFLLGILHSTLAFVPYKRLNANALWFLGTGLALLFYAVLNLIHARHREEPDIRLIVRVTNVLMLLFIALAVAALGVKGNPQVVVLVATGILMLGLSFSN